MVYKRYSSPFEEKRKPIYEKEQHHEEPKQQRQLEKSEHNHPSLGFLDRLSSDDIMIIALIIVLLSEEKGKRDVPMILTLGFLFLIQYIDAD